MANFFGFGSTRRKNTKGTRLRKTLAKIKKLEKKAQMNTALNNAQKRLETLRRRA